MTGVGQVMTPVFPLYDTVFTYYPVSGTWRPLFGASPFRGKIGRVEKAREIKLEMTVLPGDREAVVRKIKELHPYETPVIEVREIQVPNFGG